MTDTFYVATDRDGVQHVSGHSVTWNLPQRLDANWHPGETTRAAHGELVLQRARRLIDALDEAIYLAVPEGSTTDWTDDGTTLSTSSAVLTAKTSWNDVSAAKFALDCAQHIAEGLSETEIPGGMTIGTVIDDSLEVLESMSDDAEHRLGRLARLGAVRRLRRQGDALSDIARDLLTDDIAHDIDALEDPTYVTTAAIVDAVLAAVEAVRHLALPRYITAREEVVDTHADGEPASIPTVISTPWGPIAFGVDHQNPYVPSWVAARDASIRSHDAAKTKSGSEAGEREHSWQAGRLEEYLGQQ